MTKHQSIQEARASTYLMMMMMMISHHADPDRNPAHGTGTSNTAAVPHHSFSSMIIQFSTHYYKAPNSVRSWRTN